MENKSYHIKLRAKEMLVGDDEIDGPEWAVFVTMVKSTRVHTLARDECVMEALCDVSSLVCRDLYWHWRVTKNEQ